MSACFYGEVGAFLLSFFDRSFCRDFIQSRPDFQEIFEIDQDDDGSEYLYLADDLDAPYISAKLMDILSDFDLVVSFC